MKSISLLKGFFFNKKAPQIGRLFSKKLIAPILRAAID